MIDLNAVRIFVKVVEVNGFSGASRALGLPKSTISRKVRELETVLGQRLAHRNTRGLALTEAGRRLYARCREAAEDMASAVEEARQPPAGLAGLLRITAPVGIGQTKVQPSLVRFLARHPKVRAELALSDERVNVVRNGFDLALRMGELDDSSLKVKRVAVFERILCASPAYAAEHGVPADPEGLKGHACIAIRPEAATWELQGPDGRRRVPISWRLCTNNIAAVRAAALDGAGIAEMPLHLVGDDLVAGRLVHVLKQWPPVATALSALFPAGARTAPAAKAFVEFLAMELRTVQTGTILQKNGIGEVTSRRA
ncbi:MAG: LysR family transcriptional regulator [Reyranella sp.]|uniref:LysR family transcriptional regulator n=1 Tax=Reyranella sp. TaxID=1929291 RepID=UPI001ACBBE83|nr:LysR family transcriptional regulator [Reyranella sp.]MBN9089001.1 LysR family transcriptional regulator [Reyranella sp.]